VGLCVAGAAQQVEYGGEVLVRHREIRLDFERVLVPSQR
jgi:hypothetical protein